MFLLPAAPSFADSLSTLEGSEFSERAPLRAVPAVKVQLDGRRLRVDLLGPVTEDDLFGEAAHALRLDALASGSTRDRLAARLAELSLSSVVVTQASLSPHEAGALMALVLAATPHATVLLSGGGQTERAPESRPRDSAVVPAGSHFDLAQCDAGPLRVGRAGAWFESGGRRIDLTHRPTLGRILEALALRAGTTGTSTELMDAGWPGERILRAAGLARVRVAMSTLRALGLRPHLRSNRSGHALAGSVALES